MISNIESIVGDNYLQYLKNNSKLVSGLLPSNAIKTEHGYKTDSPKKPIVITENTSQEELIASFYIKSQNKDGDLEAK